MDTFSFLLNTKINYGVGSRKKLFDILLGEKWVSVGICVDKNIVDIPIFFRNTR